ncbi:hypothetical protein BDZ94DRAFT_1266299 [Collybia nuda]|uniref:MYND-type domain-containing protein n=1 Tax=Collybia nuda TaxID=64659 RepID=A0A9P5Y332_9AGAR|nr:hypothetical protein BDZ94DRAFT_1266299 [Collybia nuda]
MSSGVALFQRAESLYANNDINGAFDYYQKSIKKILKDEIVTAKLPALVPPDFPQETLGAVWRNFLGFFRDPTMNFTEQSAPEAYKLLNSFRPASSRSHPRLEKTTRGKVLLKGMQVTAGLTLGIMAWDKKDRATAAKRYKEAIDLAATHPPFNVLPSNPENFERWVYGDLQETKINLGILVENDTVNAQLLGANAPGRRGVADLPLPTARVDKTGEVTEENSAMFATDACANCGKRDVKLLRCSSCKQVPYCGVDCQRADWKSHRASGCVKKNN